MRLRLMKKLEFDVSSHSVRIEIEGKRLTILQK